MRASDESGKKRRERGLAKAGNARVRRGMIELAWGHLLHQKASALTEWYRKRTSDTRGGKRKTMIVALARKLLIALWRLVTTGETPVCCCVPPRRKWAWPRRCRLRLAMGSSAG
jgi:transposase